MSKLYDCFTFFNELDVLEIRFAELADVVDHFVIVEAARSFTGKPKPLYFAENAARYAACKDKIIHVVVDDMPVDAPDAWSREYFQRNAIARGLRGTAADDVIMLSDADEIPRASVIRGIMADGLARGGIVFLELDHFCYRMNLKASGFKWRKGTRLIEKRHLGPPQDFRALRIRSQPKAWRTNIDPVRLRLDIRRRFGRWLTPLFIADAGWHFSYMGDNDAIRLKVQSFSHQEFNQPELLSDSYIDGLIASGQFFDKSFGAALQAVSLGPNFPDYLRVNAARYAKYLAPAEAAP